MFSFWNYFVNFRSTGGFKQSLPRYVAALGTCAVINYFLTTAGFKLFAHGLPSRQAAVIAGSTFIVSGFKFLLYHFWVYPHKPAAKEEAVAQG